MIEIEIRGRLDDDEYRRLEVLLSQKGQLKEKHKREMYLLYDYPGYDHDPTKRETDIRIRDTDGFCEIMVKHKALEGNRARKEISLPLKDGSLENAREIVKAFGCKRGLKMIREKQVFDYLGIEWSLVNCPPKNIRYFEAEKTAQNETDIQTIHNELVKAAESLGLKPLNDVEMREFIYWLDNEVNVEVNL